MIKRPGRMSEEIQRLVLERATELEKMRVEQTANQTRMEDLRNLQIEKEKLEKEMERKINQLILLGVFILLVLVIIIGIIIRTRSII